MLVCPQCAALSSDMDQHLTKHQVGVIASSKGYFHEKSCDIIALNKSLDHTAFTFYIEVSIYRYGKMDTPDFNNIPAAL
jgi:hypothetical protein